MNCPRCGSSVQPHDQRAPATSAPSLRLADEAEIVAHPIISAALVIRREQRPDAYVLRLQGDLDSASSPLLEGELEDAEAAGAGNLVIDLSGLRFVDGIGMAVLRAAQRRSREKGHRLSLLRGPVACLPC